MTVLYQEKMIFIFFGQLFVLEGPSLALLDPLLASPLSGLSPRPTEIRIQPSQNKFSTQLVGATSEKQYFGFLPPKFASSGLEAIIGRSILKVHLQGEQHYLSHMWPYIWPYMAIYGHI